MKIDNEILKYFLKAFALYLLYYFIYELWINPDGRLNQWLNNVVAMLGNKVLVWFGYESCRTGTSVCINGISTVNIGNGCNGLEIYAIFTAFIIIYSGRWFIKLIYIIGGILVIFSINILRVVLLSIDHYNNLKLFHFNHKYTYVFVVYSVVFILWILWVTKFANKRGIS